MLSFIDPGLWNMDGTPAAALKLGAPEKRISLSLYVYIYIYIMYIMYKYDYSYNSTI